MRGYNPIAGGDKSQIKQAAEAIMKAKKPVIYVGGGAVFGDAADEVRELAEITQIPVTMTLMGSGSFPGTHRYRWACSACMVAIWTNMAMHYADLLIAVGARFRRPRHRQTLGILPRGPGHPYRYRSDVDHERPFMPHIPIVGDVKSVLRQMNVMLRSLDGNPAQQ